MSLVIANPTSNNNQFLDKLVGKNIKMQRVYEAINAAIDAESTVLISGESGTGKKLAAKAIHYNGKRAKSPFIPVNCDALTSEFIERELFGFKKGTFRGALTDFLGLFRSAEGGTIFLDKITEMSIKTQAKLMRVLQEKLVRPLGDTSEYNVNIRVIAATNRDLDIAFSHGFLTKDFYYRLNVIAIHMPSLRERIDDIPLLVEYFINKNNENVKHRIDTISEKALVIMMGYHWPGNVRELENVIKGIIALKESEMIMPEDLHFLNRKDDVLQSEKSYTFNEICTIKEAEIMLIKKALDVTKNNKSKAAEMLGISRTRLYKKLYDYQIF